MAKNNMVTEIHGTDLRPTYRLKNDTIAVTEEEVKIDPPSPEVLLKMAEFERKAILKRERNFNEGVDLFKNFDKINIELIHDTPPGWNLFNDSSEMEILDLARSVCNVGLIHPIYVSLDPDGIYTVICGRCRLAAFVKLYQSTGLEKYKYIPAYVLNTEEIDELFLRTLIVESNISFRTITKYNKITSLIENYEIMKRTKLYRNEKNVAMELAKIYDISESSVFNFLRVKQLCDPGLTLLYEDRISLKAALYLTKVSKETQVNILERYGVEGVNAIFRLKLLTSEDNISIEKLDEKINVVSNLTPITTKIIIEVHRELVNPFFNIVASFKRTDVANFAGKDMRGKIKKAFKVKYNKDDMGYYIEKNIIDEKILKKLEANTIGEMIKIK